MAKAWETWAQSLNEFMGVVLNWGWYASKVKCRRDVSVFAAWSHIEAMILRQNAGRRTYSSSLVGKDIAPAGELIGLDATANACTRCETAYRHDVFLTLVSDAGAF